MQLFDIIGPVMVGPSSSHTAGAVKIGSVCRKLLGEPLVSADIYLHGSFLSTGRGHGTDKAMVGGLIGLGVDNMDLVDSFALAEKVGLRFRIVGTDLGDVHPNSAKLVLRGKSGRTLEVVAASLGGGRIQVCELDGITVNFSGECPTLVLHNQDVPGHVAAVTGMLGHMGINIAAMQLYRKSRGGSAVMVLELDQELPDYALSWLEHLEGVEKVTYLSLLEGGTENV